MSSSSSNNDTDDSKISIVADSPSRNTTAASSAGRPKKMNAPLSKTKTKSKQGTSLAQSLDDNRYLQCLFHQQDTLIQLHITLVLTKKNGKQKLPSLAQEWDIFCSLVC
jgi:hypothetical protein